MTRFNRILAIILIVILSGTFSSNSAYAEDFNIKQLVVLPSGNYNTKEAQLMMERLNKIPSSVLSVLRDKGVKIILTNDIITNVPELNYLKKVTPRGWEGTGLTWDDVPGVSEKNVVVRIGYSQKGKGHSSFNLEIHETLHAVDRFVFNGISDSESFKTVFNKEASINYNNDNYVSTYPAEYFAEAASLYLFDDTTRQQLHDSTPLTYEFMDQLFNK